MSESINHLLKRAVSTYHTDTAIAALANAVELLLIRVDAQENRIQQLVHDTDPHRQAGLID